MPKQSVVSIIVPVRYRADLTRVCIDSIRAYTKNYELIMVQEGEDEQVTELLKTYADIKYVQNKIPKGYSGALNTGMELATGDIYCFLNNDTVATPGWMDEMVECLKQNDEAGLVVPTFWGTGERQSADWYTNTRFEWVLEPFSVMGVCFVIPREVMGVLDDPKYPGKWDEDFFHGGEDFDIALRVQRAHYRIYIARKSFIYHYGGASTRIFVGTDLAKVQKHHYEKVLQLINKHNLDAENVFERLQIK
jgi:GT2 family glycosyltransferase